MGQVKDNNKLEYAFSKISGGSKWILIRYLYKTYR